MPTGSLRQAWVNCRLISFAARRRGSWHICQFSTITADGGIKFCGDKKGIKKVLPQALKSAGGFLLRGRFAAFLMVYSLAAPFISTGFELALINVRQFTDIINLSKVDWDFIYEGLRIVLAVNISPLSISDRCGIKTVA